MTDEHRENRENREQEELAARHPERWEEEPGEAGGPDAGRGGGRGFRGGRGQESPGRPRSREDVERWIEEYLPRAWMRRWGWPSWGELTRPMERMGPRVDVIDREDEVLVRAEIPGVRKEDLDVTVVENAVTIRGTTGFEEREERGEYYRAEIGRGDFARSVGLPAAVDPDRCDASFRDGILELRMPKISRGKRRRVDIR